ncbi:MAG: annexin, partial [Candidatus Obscuribacterales bacterium]|nr:annexin [Candidatus Obscuribacterales bacterium]
SKADRDTLDEIYRARVGYGIEDELKDELSGSDLEKSMSLWTSTNIDAARINVALIEHKEWGLSARSDQVCEKDIRDAVSTMNSAQIAELDVEYRQKHKVSIHDALLNDENLSKETKEALAIYLKGTDKRTGEDTLKLADIALKGKNLDMFNEAIRDARPEDRQAFLDAGGRQRVLEAFGTRVGRGSNQRYLESEDTRHALDYVELGKLDVATRIKDNTGTFNDNEAAIEQTLKTMTDEERQSYILGKKLSGSDNTNLSPTDKASLDYYNKVHAAMAGAGNEREIAQWEDLITEKEGGLVSRLAKHGGMFDDGMDEVLRSIEEMTESQWKRIKEDPQYLARVKDVLKIDLSEDEMQRAGELLDRKVAAESYDQSKGTQRSLVESIKDESGFWNTDEEGLFDAIKRMTPEEQERYRSDETYRKQIDDLVRGNLDVGHEQKAAFELLDSLKRGENPQNNIIAKLHTHADYFNTDEAKVIADLEKAFKDDPTLRDRLKTDPEYAARFDKSLAQALDPDEYERYARPLIEEGRLPFKLKAELYQGVFNDDEKSLYESIAQASAADWQEIKADPKNVLPFLSDEERSVAVNIACQEGEMRPEDKLRAAVLGAGTDVTAIKAVLEEMTPAQLDVVKANYLSKYDSDLLADLMSEEGGAIRDLFVDKVGAQPTTDREAFDIQSQRVYKSVDGIGRAFVDGIDGTGDMALDSLNQYASGMSQYSRRFEEMPVEVKAELQENLNKAVELYRESESSAADMAIDGVIIAAGIAGAKFTGGVSLSLLAYTTDLPP